eukprot:scaffold196200_cov29-Tisochrysis_lutea.AAC.1
MGVARELEKVTERPPLVEVVAVSAPAEGARTVEVARGAARAASGLRAARVAALLPRPLAARAVHPIEKLERVSLSVLVEALDAWQAVEESENRSAAAAAAE